MTGIECEICARPSADQVPFCYRCADTFRAELMAVPGLVADLHITGDRLDKLGRGTEGGKSAEVPLPIRLGRDGFPNNYGRPLANLHDTIAEWFDVVSLKTGRPARRGDLVTNPPAGLVRLVLNNRAGRTYRYDPTELMTHPVSAAELMAVWIAHQPRAIRAVPNPVVMYDDVTATIDHIRRLVDRLPERTLRGPCPYLVDQDGERVRCGARLYAERGETWVRCPKCRTLHDVRTLESDALSKAENELFELHQIRIIMAELGEPIPKSTLYAWANDPTRQRLEPAGWKRPAYVTIGGPIDHGEVPLYRLGDVRRVREIVEREKRESQAAR